MSKFISTLLNDKFILLVQIHWNLIKLCERRGWASLVFLGFLLPETNNLFKPPFLGLILIFSAYIYIYNLTHYHINNFPFFCCFYLTKLTAIFLFWNLTLLFRDSKIHFVLNSFNSASTLIYRFFLILWVCFKDQKIDSVG